MRSADFVIPARGLTNQAETYADSAPLDLIDGARLVKILNQSKKHVLMPQTYEAMCRQCGELVQHRIDRDQDEARPCATVIWWRRQLPAPCFCRRELQRPKTPASPL